MKITTALLLSLFFISGGKKEALFSAKSIEGRMVKVSETFYANKYETTNAEYREFLEWVKTNQPTQLEAYQVRHKGWNDFFQPPYSTNYFTNKGFDNYPVVNISHESALAFCQWLTRRYNESVDKKKKFREVKFRLPTREEWVDLALNGRDRITKYPWGGPYLRNSKGKAMANFRRIGDEAIKMDMNDPTEVEITHYSNIEGRLVVGNEPIISPVDSYLATGPGLHNLSGNAAEMLAEKGHTKGGSWRSSGYYLQIQAEDEFEGFTANPYVGFRYVMEVIRE